MNCKHCGKELSDNYVYCPFCGGLIEPLPESLFGEKTEQVSTNIYRNSKGVFKWYYEYNMLKNPSIMLTVFSVLGIAELIEFSLVFCIMLLDDSDDAFAAFPQMLAVHLAIFAVLIVIGFVAYFIVAWLYGFKYKVIFELDEKSLRHIHLPRQFKKANALGILAVFLGGITKDPALAGIGLMSASRNVMISSLYEVRTVKVYKKRNLIKLNQLFKRNQVYVENDDFDFILNRLIDCCKNAQVIYK